MGGRKARACVRTRVRDGERGEGEPPAGARWTPSLLSSELYINTGLLLYIFPGVCIGLGKRAEKNLIKYF